MRQIWESYNFCNYRKEKPFFFLNCGKVFFGLVDPKIRKQTWNTNFTLKRKKAEQQFWSFNIEKNVSVCRSNFGSPTRVVSSYLRLKVRKGSKICFASLWHIFRKVLSRIESWQQQIHFQLQLWLPENGNGTFEDDIFWQI